LDDFNKAIELNSKNPLYYANRANTYLLMQNKTKEALEDLKKAS
jgi:hypothetical protein